MLEKFKKIASNARALRFNDLAKKAFSDPDLQKEMVTMITIEQLYEKGEDGDGNSLPDYSPATIRIKKEKGQRTDHTTLNDTGDYYASHKVIVSDKEARITADTLKGANNITVGATKENRAVIVGTGPTDLAQRYGNSILKLNPDNHAYTVSQVKNSIIAQVREKLFS